MIVAGGTSLATFAAISTSDRAATGRIALASVAYVPATWLIIAAGTMLFGLLPRAATLAWGLVAAVIVVGLFGTLLELPKVIVEASPFEHTPLVPAAEWELRPLAVITVLAAALAVLGVAAFSRRSIPQ
jgi:ABC-2 type transport system permease protein